MYKKKLQRLGAVCLAAAMVFTTFSFPDAVKAEEGTATQADETTSTELEKGKVLVQVNQNILEKNAIANTEQNPFNGDDGGKTAAFDGSTATKWHTQWSPSETVSATNHGWIGSGFGKKILLKEIQYDGWKASASDTNERNRIRDYKLYITTSDTVDANSTWKLVAEGQFTQLQNNKIELDTAREATGFKLEDVQSVNNGYNTHAAEIRAYELKDISLELTAPTKADNGATVYDNAAKASAEDSTGVEDISAKPATFTGTATVDADGSFSGRVTSSDSKLDFTGTKPFLIEFEAKFDTVPTEDMYVVGRGPKNSEQYRIGYNNGKWKFAIHNSNTNGGGDGWHDYGVTVPESQKTEWNKITAFYTGTHIVIMVNETSKNISSNSDNWNVLSDVGQIKEQNGSEFYIGGHADKAMETYGGHIKNLRVYQADTLQNSGINQGTDYNKIMYYMENANTVLNFNTSGFSGYEVNTNWSKTSKEKENYQAVMTISATNGNSIVAQPKAVNINMDGTHKSLLPVSEANVTNEDGSVTVKYAFEDMFKGGSLRLDAGEGLTKTNMRFGYSVGVAQDKFVKSSWYYGTSADNLSWSLLDGTKSAVIGGDFVSNIVFTNLPSSAYNSKVYARGIVTYKDDNNVVRSKMSTFIDSRSAVDVARGVKADCDKKNDQTSEAYKHATNVLQAAGITD